MQLRHMFRNVSSQTATPSSAKSVVLKIDTVNITLNCIQIHTGDLVKEYVQ
jgi:hypothetical protein